MLNLTAMPALPEYGKVQYEGYLVAGLPLPGANQSVVHHADLHIELDFEVGADFATGQASNFTSTNGDTLDGVLAIKNGFIDREADIRTDYVFGADMIGTLSDGTSNFTIDSEIAGEFRGTNANAISGIVYGSVAGPSESALFDGVFAGVAQ